MDLYKMQLEEEGTEREALKVYTRRFYYLWKLTLHPICTQKHKLKEATNEFDYTLKSLRHSHAEVAVLLITVSMLAAILILHFVF